MENRSLGDPIAYEVVVEAAKRIMDLYSVSEARAMRLAMLALYTFEAKGGWVSSVDKEVESVLEVVVSKWIKNGIAADAHESWFEGKDLIISKRRFQMDYPIKDIVEYDDLIVILYEYSSFEGVGQFSNLFAVDRDGNEIWRADHPTTDSSSAYVRITSSDPLVVSNFTSYQCTIDVNSGRIVDTVLTK
jgi:hypothetical protein